MNTPEPKSKGHTMTDNDEGDLPAARRNLDNAISTLIDPKPITHDGTIHWTDSLYNQLTDQIPGGQGNASQVHKSSPPICIDASELKTLIDKATLMWEPQTHTPPVDRLRQLATRKWRPQDTDHIGSITATINAWCERIRNILNPQPKWSLPNPCPACNTAIIYRKNSADELVRQPALQIGALGCTCQNCHAQWAPEYFQHLANVLGYQLPPGVLE